MTNAVDVWGLRLREKGCKGLESWGVGFMV